MKIKFSLFAIIALSILLFSSCQKNDLPEGPSGKSIKELVVPQDFDWSTVEELSVQIGVNTEDNPSDLNKIMIFGSAPWDGGALILSGAASKENPFVSKMALPAGQESVFIKRISRLGISEITEVPITGNQLVYSFERPENLKVLKTLSVGPDCNSNCDQTISGSGNVNIGGGQTYCVTSSFTGNINFQNSGGTLKVCGTLNVGNINLGQNCHLIFTDGSTVNINGLSMANNSSLKAYGNADVTLHNFNMNHSSSIVENYSSNFEITSTFSPNGSVLNDGNLTVTGGMNVNNNGSLINSGYLDVNGNFNTNDEVINNGTIDVSGHVNLNNSEVSNNCSFICAGDFNVNNVLFINNTGYVYVGLKMTVNGGSDIRMYQSTLFDVRDFTVNNDMIGYGTTNSVNVRQETRVNGSNKKIRGAIEVADNDGVLASGSVLDNFAQGATFVSLANATNYIPATGCNPTGFGTPDVSDADNDGVSDVEDAYPNDPARAFDSWYPNASQWCSVAFEDLWPGMGDYDFNDLVVVYRIRTITNASNNVVNLKPEVFITAAGASFSNGFGIQFDNLIPSQIQSVSGYDLQEGIVSLSPNGTEAGQSKAVVILFDNHRNIIQAPGSSFFNTEPFSPAGSSDTIRMDILLSSPLSPLAIGAAPFNPFIFVNGVRSHEVHMLDQVPTNLMDYSLFGTASDASIPAEGKFFRTSDNLPWAVQVPIQFEHMVEKQEITTGYLYFSNWAESAGAQYQQWYRTQLSGYTDLSKIWNP